MCILLKLVRMYYILFNRYDFEKLRGSKLLYIKYFYIDFREVFLLFLIGSDF